MRESIPVKIKLQIVLRYFAIGDCLGKLEALNHVPRCKISKLITKVLAEIYEVVKDQIKISNSISYYNSTENVHSIKNKIMNV